MTTPPPSPSATSPRSESWRAIYERMFERGPEAFSPSERETIRAAIEEAWNAGAADASAWKARALAAESWFAAPRSEGKGEG